MFVILIMGILIMAFGLLLMFFPAAVEKANKLFNKCIVHEDSVMAQKMLFAIVCLAVGALLILTYFRQAF